MPPYGGTMKQSMRPMWKKSMLQSLNLWDIHDYLCEISENGDCYGYEREGETGESGYYQEYKELFNELSAGAFELLQALHDSDVSEHWDDMTVALLGDTTRVLGFDSVQMDYYGMLCNQEEWATEEAAKRLERLSKHDLIKTFKRVMTVLVCFFDIKAAHDCLTSIVQELDEKGAILERKNEAINRIYEDYTDLEHKELDKLIESISPNSRMWVE